MHNYHDLRPVFQLHLGEFFNPPDILDGDGGLNRHMYLGHLLYEMGKEDASDDFRRRVVELVEDLHRNGDELSTELVHVSFFENMDNLPRNKVRNIRSLFSKEMQKVMDDAFIQLGYSYD